MRYSREWGNTSPFHLFLRMYTTKNKTKHARISPTVLCTAMWKTFIRQMSGSLSESSWLPLPSSEGGLYALTAIFGSLEKAGDGKKSSQRTGEVTDDRWGSEGELSPTSSIFLKAMFLRTS